MATLQSMMALAAFLLLTASAPASRADDLKDDVRKDTHDVKRSVTKTGHRVAEAACTGTKTDCAAKKAKHRVQETDEKVGDKVDEITH
jgi:hypothetical protein